MPIKIVKKNRVDDVREPAPLVANAIPAKPSEASPERTAAVALKDWHDNMVPPNARPIQCEFCKCFYLKPCNKERAQNCQNYHFAQSKLGVLHG